MTESISLLLADLTFQEVECFGTTTGNNRGTELFFSTIEKVHKSKVILKQKDVSQNMKFPEIQVFFSFSI